MKLKRQLAKIEERMAGMSAAHDMKKEKERHQLFDDLMRADPEAARWADAVAQEVIDATVAGAPHAVNCERVNRAMETSTAHAKLKERFEAFVLASAARVEA